MRGYVPDYFCKVWLLTNLQYNQETFASTTTIQQALPINPLRHALLLGNTSAGNVFWRIGPKGGGQNTMLLSNTSGPMFLSRDIYGDAICMEVLVSSAAAFSATVTEWSYDPARWSLYQRLLSDAFPYQ